MRCETPDPPLPQTINAKRVAQLVRNSLSQSWTVASISSTVDVVVIFSAPLLTSTVRMILARRWFSGSPSSHARTTIRPTPSGCGERMGGGTGRIEGACHQRLANRVTHGDLGLANDAHFNLQELAARDDGFRAVGLPTASSTDRSWPRVCPTVEPCRSGRRCCRRRHRDRELCEIEPQAPFSPITIAAKHEPAF
jgi:hypothetical protein